MKRSPMPRRRTPLRAIKPLRRAAALPAVSAKRKVAKAGYRQFKASLHARAGGQCEWDDCTRWATPDAPWTHHRLTQKRGGPDTLTNAVWLCIEHHDYVHAHPATSTRTGWLVPSSVDPASWPVLRTHYGRRGWWQPSESGWTEATPDERQEVA